MYLHDGAIDYFSEDYVDYNATIEQMKKIAEIIERFE